MRNQSNPAPLSMDPCLRSTPCQFLPVGELQVQAWGSDPVNTDSETDTGGTAAELSERGSSAAGWCWLQTKENEKNTDKPTWVEDAGSRPIWIGLKAPPDHSTKLHWLTIAETELTLDNI